MSTDAEIQSPCIGVCSMDDTTGFCHGCYRSIEEISAWWGLSHAQKAAVIAQTGFREAQQFSD